MWPEPQIEVIHCEKAISQGIQEGSLDAGKGKETVSPGASKRNQLCQHFDVNSLTPPARPEWRQSGLWWPEKGLQMLPVGSPPREHSCALARPAGIGAGHQ